MAHSDYKIEQDLTKSFYELIRDSKAEQANQDKPFVRYSKGGKLIIDLDDLNCLGIGDKNYKILEVLNELKETLTK